MAVRNAALTSPMYSTTTTHDLVAGFGWGVLAAVAMSALMIAATVTGLSPMPKPIPVALVGRTLGPGLAKPAMMAIGAVLHLGYGGTVGALLAWLGRPVTARRDLALGVALWAVMQVVWLPYLGWGLFGHAITPRIAVATLVLHLVYGGTLGWLLSRRQRSGAG